MNEFPIAPAPKEDGSDKKEKIIESSEVTLPSKIRISLPKEKDSEED